MKSQAKFAMVLLCIFAGFWAPYVGAAMDVVLPPVASTLHLSGSAYNGILLAGTLAAAVFYLPIGHLSDRFGRKRLFCLGIILAFISVLLSGFAPNALCLILGSAILSVAGAVLYVNAVALGCGYFSKNGSGKIIGCISAGIYAGRMLGPALGGFITDALGWRWVFFTAALFGLLLLFLLSKVDEKLPEPGGKPFDWPGVAIFSLGIMAMIYGFTMTSSNLNYVWLALAGIVLLLLFWLWEHKSATPILPLKLFRGNRLLGFSLATIVLSYTATYGVAALGSLYLQYTVKLSTQITGLMIAILPLMQMLLSPIAGRAADAYSARKVATCGLGGAVVGLLILLQVGPQSSIWVYGAALAVLGASLAFISTPNTQSVMNAMPGDYLSLGSSLVGEFRNIGESFSIGVVNIVLVTQIGYQLVGAGLVQELMNTFHLVIFCFLLAALAAALCSWLRGK